MLKEYCMTAAGTMNLALTEEQADKLVRFHEMLTAANARINLTRVSAEWREAADRNYLDSMEPARFLPKGIQTMVDVGTGAGFPGIPLSILRQDIRVTLLDSLGKRVEFLQSVIDALQLNACAVHIRAEEAGRQAAYRDAFDVAVSRAVAPMNVLCELCLPLVRPGGQLLALKGPGLDEEIRQAENAFAQLGGRCLALHPMEIPGRDWNHCLAVVEKISPTPEKFPRRAGMPEKKPIL